MPDIPSVYLVGRLGLTVGDGSDPDTEPDVLWCTEGTVRFTPVNSYVKVSGGSPVPWTAGNAAIDVPIDTSGYLSWSAARHVSMLDLASEAVNPTVAAGRATHKVEFRSVKADPGDGNKITVSFPTTTVRLSADAAAALTADEATAYGLTEGDMACDLTLLTPVPSAGGTPIIVGPPGAGIVSLDVDGNALTYALTNGDTGQTDLPDALTDSDAATASRILDPDSATAGALGGVITDQVIDPAQVAARVLGWSQLDRQGQGALARLRAQVAITQANADEVLEDWADLASVTYNQVAVSDNMLIAASNTSPQGAKIPVTIDDDGILFTARIMLGTAASFCGVGFASTDTAIKASSTDAYMIGVSSAKNPAYLRGTDIGGSGQAAIDTGVTFTAGDECLITGAVRDGQVSLTMTHLPSGVTYTRTGTGHSVPTSAWSGGIGTILCYTGSGSGGASGQIGPVAAIGAVTRRRTTTLGGEDISTQTETVHMAVGGDNRTLLISAKTNPQIPAPLAVYLHNSGGSALNSIQDTRIIPFVQALLDAGINVVMADAGGSAWGNDTNRSLVVAAYEWSRDIVAVSSVILTGQSMGGQTAFNLLARNEIPNIAAALLVAPVTSLDDLWADNAGGYSANIRTAFGIADDGSDYETLTAGYRPEDRAGWEFRGVPLMIISSPDDATCHKANADTLVAKVAPYSPEATVVASTGGHMDAAQFTDAVTYGIPFLAKYAA